MQTRPILKNKSYLYLTEFFSGVAVMAVELGASRLLAPYFSSSQIVWTIIIGTIMIAMALGNIWGGRRADRDPSPDRLYLRLMLAAIWIAAIPVVGKYLILLISGVLIVTISDNLLIWAAFLACMVIFVFPCFLLGTVTPSLIKYTVDSLDDNGKTVGMMEASNTVGSILGTFLPTFVTIPTVGTSVTFLIFSAILLLLSLIYFLSAHVKRIHCAVALGLFVLCSLFGHADSFAFWEKDLAYEGESIYNYLQVKETDDSVILSTNVLFGVQSIAKKDGSLTGLYYDYALAAPVMAQVQQKTAPRALVLGMGTGTFATQCQKYFDNLAVEGVEIDQKIVDLAGTYFGLSDQVSVTTYDGRAYLGATDQLYDVIMVDAYQDITIPFQMSSVEFFTMVKDHLTADGVMVVNMNMHSDAPGNINQYLSDTIASVFDTVYTVEVPHTTNRELFATNAPLSADALQALAGTLSDPELQALVRTVLQDMTPYQSSGLLLTDDRAPVELLGMRAIDSLIQSELQYYKDVYRAEGISGILDQVSG